MNAMKKGAIKLAVALLGIGLVIMAGAFAVSGFSPLRLSRTVSGYEERTKDFVGTSFSQVRIQEIDANIRVLPSEDGRCSVHYDETDRSTYHVEIIDDALVIEHERDWLDSFGIFMSAPKLTVYLPRVAYAQIDVHTVSGGIQIDGLEFGKMNLEATSGGIRLNEVSVDAGSLRAKTVSGGIQIAELTAGEMDLETTSGGIRLTDVTANEGHLSAKAVSGGIRLENVDAGSLELRTVSGGIRGTLRSGKVFEASSVSGSVKVPESTPGAGSCRAATTSGGISISIAE